MYLRRCLHYNKRKAFESSVQRRKFTSNGQQNRHGSEEEAELLISNTVFAQRALMAAGMIYCFNEYGYSISLCEGPSMSPTIRSSGEIILIDKWSVRKYGICDGTEGEERAKYARSKQKEADDTNVWHQPHVSIDDLGPASWREVMHQTFSPLSVGDVVVVNHPNRDGTVCKRVLGLPGDSVLPRNGRLVVVPDGHLWVEGDNPGNSSDSRSYGPVPIPLLVGRACCRLWPLRGQASLRRGGSPRPAANAGPFRLNSTVLPAGYDGERIVKTLNEADSMQASK